LLDDPSKALDLSQPYFRKLESLLLLVYIWSRKIDGRKVNNCSLPELTGFYLGWFMLFFTGYDKTFYKQQSGTW